MLYHDVLGKQMLSLLYIDAGPVQQPHDQGTQAGVCKKNHFRVGRL